MTISLVMTVLNEGDNIHQVMNSLMNQTRPPDEVVIVDGGSTDDTANILRGYAEHQPLRVLVEAGCNISRGRNIAIAAAQGEIIAVTDAGVRRRLAWGAEAHLRGYTASAFAARVHACRDLAIESWHPESSRATGVSEFGLDAAASPPRAGRAMVVLRRR